MAQVEAVGEQHPPRHRRDDRRTRRTSRCPAGSRTGRGCSCACATTSDADSSTIGISRRGCSSARSVLRMIDGSGGLAALLHARSSLLHHARSDGAGHAGARRFGRRNRDRSAEIAAGRPSGGVLWREEAGALNPLPRARRDHHGRQRPLGAARGGCRASTGHRQGAEAVRDVVRAARELGRPRADAVRVLRAELGAPADEVADLMQLLRDFVVDERAEIWTRGIRLIDDRRRRRGCRRSCAGRSTR